MGFFGSKKKDMIEGLPDLPELDVDPGLPDIGGGSSLDFGREYNASPLPRLPQDAGMDYSLGPAVNNFTSPAGSRPFLNSNEVRDHNGVQRSSYTIDEVSPVISEPMPSREVPRMSGRSSSRTKGEDLVYVRLDKFQATKQALDDIREKIIDVEKVLHKIRDIKEKEERELAQWEQEVGAMKARIDSIDKDIFGSVS